MSELSALSGKALEDLVQVKHHFSSGVYAKEQCLPRGWTAVTHRHAYDHLSILARGAVLLTTDSGVDRLDAPICVQIRRGIEHRILALEDCVWYCIHHTDETDPTKLDQVLVERT